MSLFKCENQTCKSSGNFVACLYCSQSFYCSVNCREDDYESHKTICHITNSRQILTKNVEIIDSVKSNLSRYALLKLETEGPGIINIRSYDSIFSNNIKIFISYTKLNEWNGNVPKILSNDYTKKMIINLNIFDMNKPQLHCVNIVKNNNLLSSLHTVLNF